MGRTRSSSQMAHGEKKDRQEEPEPKRLHCACVSREGNACPVSSLKAMKAHRVNAAKLDAELASPLPCGKLLYDRTVNVPV